MYVLYMDESGDPNSWDSQNHFVLAGLAVHEGQIYRLTQQLDKLQTDYFPEIAVPIAFHAGDIRSGHKRFRELDDVARRDLLDDLYKVIQSSRFPNVIAFSTTIHISAVESSEQAFRETFQDICQRFNTFLVRQFNSGYKDKGLLIIDQAHEQRYRDLIAEFRIQGTEHAYLGNIVDIPYFAGRRDTRLLQLADLMAYAVFRFYESSDRTYFEKVLNRFDRRAAQQPPDGLKHITRQSCECEACVWR